MDEQNTKDKDVVDDNQKINAGGQEADSEKEVRVEDQLYNNAESSEKKEEEVKKEDDREEKIESSKETDKSDTEKKEDKEYNLDSFDLSEDNVLPKEEIEKIVQFGKEQGFSKKQVQAAIDRENDSISSKIEGLAVKSDEWVKQISLDKELGGENFNKSAELAKRVVQKFGSEELKKILRDSYFGNHPEVIRIFSRIGKAMSADELVLSGEIPARKKTTAELLYGENAK